MNVSERNAQSGESNDDIFGPWLQGTIVIILLFVLIFAIVIYYGWAFWMLWGWFAVPAGLPELPFWNLVGLSVLIRMCVVTGSNIKKDDRPTDKRKVIASLISPVAFVCMGWAIQSWGM